MAASRITRKRTNASSSSKAKKFPPPSSSTKSVHEVAILKNEQKEEEEKRDEKPGCDEITDPKRDGNDQSNGEALENHSIPLIHANAAAKTVDANPHLSPPKFSYKKVPSNTIIQPSSSAGNEWTPRHFPPVFSLQQQQQQHHHQHQHQHQQQMLQMMMSHHAGMMDPSSNAFMQYNNFHGANGGAAGAANHHAQNNVLMGNPIHDFLQMQQNPTAFPTRYLINAQNGPFPFPWPPVGMPPFPTFPAAAGMSGARHQIDNAAAPPPTTTPLLVKRGEGDAQQKVDEYDKNENNTQKKSNAAAAAAVAAATAAEDQENEKDTRTVMTTTRLAENGSGMSSDNFQTTTVTTAANNTFGSVSNGKKTATRVLPTEEQLEHRQRYLQQQQQLNQFNAFNALQQNGAAYSAYAAALSMGQPNTDSPSFAAQHAFQQHQQQQQHLHNMMNKNFSSNQQHQQQMYLHQQQHQQQQQQQHQQHEYQQPPPHSQTTTTTPKKGKQGVPKSNRNRLVWNDELHRRFMNAVNHLGLDAAVPKTIMQMMNVEGLTRENVASHLQKYRLKQMTAEEKAAMNAKSAMKKNESHSTMDDSYYAGEGKELLNGNAPNKRGASLKRPAGSETDILEGTKKSKTQIEGTADDAAAPTEVNITATANTTTDGPAAQEGKDSGESSDERDAGNNSGGENNSKHPPYHHSDTNEKEQQEQELPKKQQRSKRGKSSSDDEASDKDNFGQQHRVVVGN